MVPKKIKIPNSVYRLSIYAVPDILLIVLSFKVSTTLTQPHLGFSLHLSPEPYVALLLLVRVATLKLLGVYKIIWRYISLKDVIKLVKALFLSSLVVTAGSYFLNIPTPSRSAFVIDFFLVTLLLTSIRCLRRFVYEESHQKLSKHGRRTLVYGAGGRGKLLVQKLTLQEQETFNIVGFIDDDVIKTGCEVLGVPVLGTQTVLPHYIQSLGIQELLVAIAPAPPQLLNQLLEICRPFGIKPRIMQGLPLQQKTQVELCRQIELPDLLLRRQRKIDLNEVRTQIKGSVVLVTGAGGSIGSELCRQLNRCEPAQLLLVDHSELNLFEIDKELRGYAHHTHQIVPLLIDIKDAFHLTSVFEKYRPDNVFHAAAYKHVHLVESNPLSSSINNILGTKNLLDLSAEYDVENFVLISTDKAVNPVGIMGATKRICELLVTQTGLRTKKRYASVRFGNVLGSSGSLIPSLQKQINEEKIVTITDKDMRRYFMLIPEAVSLVLKAATIASPGDIMVLRMGDPIRIVDIVQKLIHLMGYSPEEVSIVYTGLRPGEKLFEELYLNGDEIDTSDPDILVIPRGDTNRLREKAEVDERLEKIVKLLLAKKPEALREIRSLANENPQTLFKPQVEFNSTSLPLVGVS